MTSPWGAGIVSGVFYPTQAQLANGGDDGGEQGKRIRPIARNCDRGCLSRSVDGSQCFHERIDRLGQKGDAKASECRRWIQAPAFRQSLDLGDRAAHRGEPEHAARAGERMRQALQSLTG